MTDTPQGNSEVADMAESQRRLAQVMSAAIQSGGLPSIYANGIGIAQTATDLSLILLLNGNPISLLSMSFTTAKGLATDLQQALAEVERATKTQIHTASEMERLLRSAKKE